jgi:DNA-binding NarL/FixJ family response regulator
MTKLPKVLAPAPPAPGRIPRIVVFSDRTVFRDCLVEYLRHSGFKGTTGAPEVSALPPDEKAGPELMLIDVGQEHENPAEELRRLRERWPATTAVAIGTPIQLAAQAADADGWIEVSEPGTRLSAIAEAATSTQGPVWFEPPAEVSRQIAIWRALTARQRQVLSLLGLGLENAEIAEALGIAERTVKLHVSGLLERFGASNRVRLAVLAGQAGLRSSREGLARAKPAA